MRQVPIIAAIVVAAVLAPVAASADRMWIGFHDDPVLRYEGEKTIRDAVVPLQRTDSQGKPLGPVTKGQRGQWSISGWPVARPGTYTLTVSAPAEVPAPGILDPTAYPAGTWWDSRSFVVK